MTKYFFWTIFCLPLGAGMVWMSIFEPKWGLESFPLIRIALTFTSLIVFFYGIENFFQFYTSRPTLQYIKDLLRGKIQFEV